MDSKMDIQKIKGLIDLLADSPLAELELIEGEEKIRLVKALRRDRVARSGDGRDRAAAIGPDPVEDEGIAVPLTGTVPPSPLEGTMPHLVAAVSESRLVGSPMSGIVHLTPAPGEAPFVNIGDTVAEGQVLCTIEAMKMFNALEAEFGGTVVEILVKPGDEVDLGQPLFRVGA
jgi:acetyl-CoA carboxylase biotin carboxyl carrier protein